MNLKYIFKRSSKQVIPIAGSFKSVRLSYGNNRQDAIDYFLRKGWAFESEVRSDERTAYFGEHDWFITFRAGVNAHPIPEFDTYRKFYVL